MGVPVFAMTVHLLAPRDDGLEGRMVMDVAQVRLGPDPLREAVSLAQCLAAAGAPAWRIEHAVEAHLASTLSGTASCTASAGLVQVFYDGRVAAGRLHSADPDLGAQGLLEQPGSAMERLAAVGARRPLGDLQSIAMVVILGVAVVCSRGVDPGTLLAVAVLSAGVGGLVQLARGVASLRPLLPLLTAFFVAAAGRVFGALMPVHADVMTLAPLLMLLPGWSLTVGVAEVATGHPVSGAVRLVQAGLTLAMLVMGQAAGVALTASLPQVLAPLETTGPLWGVSWTLATVALGRLFRVPLSWLALTGVGVAVAMVQLPVDPISQAFVLAVCLGGLGDAARRSTGLPSQLVTVPGVLLRVPGGASLAGVASLVSGQPGAIEQLVEAGGQAVALVCGLLVAAAVGGRSSPES